MPKSMFVYTFNFIRKYISNLWINVLVNVSLKLCLVFSHYTLYYKLNVIFIV